MANLLVSVDNADYRLPEPVLQALSEDLGDTGNPLGAQISATIGAFEQPDFVEAARRFSPYSSLRVHKIDANTLEVVCSGGERHVIYQISGFGGYRFVGRVWEGSGESPQFDPGVDVTIERGPLDARVAELALTGTFSTPVGGNWDTSAVGATWEAEITVPSSASLAIRNRVTNRGGVWKIEIVGGAEVELSTWAAVSAQKITYDVLTFPSAGTHTVRGTFLGEDPDHAPSTSPAVGYIGSDSGAFFICAVPSYPTKTNAICAPASNKNFAIAMAHGGGADEFAPQHGSLATETEVVPPVYYAGATLLDVSAMAVGEFVDADSLTVVQHIQAHNTYAPAVERLDIQTRDRIDADGTYTMDGTIRTLAALDSSVQMYIGMLVGNPVVSDAVVTSYRKTYPATATNGTENYLPADEARSLTSVAIVGAGQPDLVAAITYGTPKETRRSTAPADQPPRMWIQHRDAVTTKVYPNLGYGNDDSIPVGTVWRFNARMWHGYSPGIRASLI